MEVLINPRSVARLAAACSVFASLAPVTAAALATPPAALPSTLPTALARHTLATDGLCDGHKWSLFGCRPDHHRIDQPEAGGLPSAG